MTDRFERRHRGHDSIPAMRSSIRTVTERSMLAILRRAARSRPAILGYHGIGNCSRAEDPSLLQISPELFETQVRLMLMAGFRFVTVADLAARLVMEESAAGLAALSFDDGMRNNLTAAAPILARFAIPATVYIAVSYIGGQSPWISGPEGEMLNREEIRRLHAQGWEVGAHSVTHPDMSTLSYPECLSEITQSQQTLQELTGTPVRTFAYPFGSYGAEAVAASRASGMLASVTSASGTWQVHELPRTMVNSGDSMTVIVLKLVDRYEPIAANPSMRLPREVRRRVKERSHNRKSRSQS
jgi:peptidoglycan/xylan/chitin deacetylase (PgdA/CDA1 family)